MTKLWKSYNLVNDAIKRHNKQALELYLKDGTNHFINISHNKPYMPLSFCLYFKEGERWDESDLIIKFNLKNKNET
jgi:hypothetical protein